MKLAESGLAAMESHVDTMIVVPNQVRDRERGREIE
jgi:cell division GTPase FtsZ